MCESGKLRGGRRAAPFLVSSSRLWLLSCCFLHWGLLCLGSPPWRGGGGPRSKADSLVLSELHPSHLPVESCCTWHWWPNSPFFPSFPLARCWVVDRVDSWAVVMFIDFGQSATIPVQSLRSLDSDDFWTIPPLTQPFMLEKGEMFSVPS